MTSNQIIKFSYHFFVFIFLLFLAMTTKMLSIFTKGILFIISLIHLYDAWWFSKYNANAPL